ncbi:hypothetical protein JAAARDRAFT_127313 [Jaapia argillacea MUCL 33604]|uniref:Protein N-terminal glutamine amidohydrolase n=1 Tax=Jaapia argillacea MUCL 33604 TaxID=933084 RepID=A0A067Q044_9AGAM|nr:hypothetical protein JAAARDRAFT_127313 [Jaapia argillacea MUCL 33604]
MYIRSWLSPPPLPLDAVYTPFYCEENIYLLAQSFLESNVVISVWEPFVVFISNTTKSVALWNQKAAEVDGLVVWDYHVVLVLRPRPPKIQEDAQEDELIVAPTTWIYDFDSQADLPCQYEEYFSQTFPFGNEFSPKYHSLFRIVPAQVVLEQFASDRSHMLRPATSADESSEYLSPPPPYPVLCGSQAKERRVLTNLMSSFVSMEDSTETFGNVLGLSAFVEWCSGSLTDE